jgi:hypothetical protein
LCFTYLEAEEVRRRITAYIDVGTYGTSHAGGGIIWGGTFIEGAGQKVSIGQTLYFYDHPLVGFTSEG